MSASTETLLTRKQLFADLEKDEVKVNAADIDEAKNGDAYLMYRIGKSYQYEKQNYNKAMAWYQLAAAKNNSLALYSIGYLYHYGHGVPQDNLLSLEWYLRSARQNNKKACMSIGDHFFYGIGVPRDGYKADEWYCNGFRKYFKKCVEIKGYHLGEKEKKKLFEALISDTENIIKQERRKEAIRKKYEEREVMLYALKTVCKQNAKQNMLYNIKPSLFKPRKSIHRAV